MSLKHVNTMGACRHEHAHEQCEPHRHTHRNLFFKPPQSCIIHSRFLEIPCSVMTSGRLQYNTRSVLWKVSKDADPTLLGMTNVTTCNKKSEQNLIWLPKPSHYKCFMIYCISTDILWQIKSSPTSDNWCTWWNKFLKGKYLTAKSPRYQQAFSVLLTNRLIMPSGENVCRINSISVNGDERLILHCKHLNL